MAGLKDLLAFDAPEGDGGGRIGAEEWERREAARRHAERVRATRVPVKYRNADIALCPPEIRAYAEGFDGKTTGGLFLKGAAGTGKTYAACAVLNALLDDYLARFTTMREVLNEIQDTYNGRGFESDVIHRWSNVKLLVIDDLGKGKPTDWALETVFQIIDNRYKNEKPTIYTTQYNGEELASRLSQGGEMETAEAILDRIKECCTSVTFGGSSRR